MKDLLKTHFYLMTKYMYIPKIGLKEILYRLSVALRLMVFTLIIPLMATFFSYMFMILEGHTWDITYIWSEYYIYGEFNGWEAWRIHLALLFILSVFCLTSDNIV